MSKTIIGVVVAVLVVLGVGVMLSKNPADKTGGKEPDKKDVSTLLALKDTDWLRGKKGAPVVVVEYGDFQCPACGSYHSLLKQLEAEMGDRMLVVFRQYPLTMIHANAWSAAVATETAGKMGKFWEMHDKLFENQKDWSELVSPTGKYVEYAKSIGLDETKFKEIMKDITLEAKIDSDLSSGTDAGVKGTPTFFVNGQQIALPGSVAEFKAILEGEIAKKNATDAASKKVHKHFDLAVFMTDGVRVDFTAEKFMEKDPNIHFHDNNDKIAHIHKEGMTLGMLFTSINYKLPIALEWSVNGKKMIDRPEEYQPKDADRIVIAAGVLTDKEQQSVTDIACIYSETCPERGKPPTEECVGGVGSDCVE